MQVTSLLSREEHEHDESCGHQHDESCSSCGHDHEHSSVHLWQTIVGVVFVINAFIVDWLFDNAHTVASASAMIGALVLGYPIIITAIKDLKLGRLSINELVAIAVLAAFASGDYKTAGVVAFFMLMGELIETRTAEGARVSIESLVKLTPTKARRIKRAADILSAEPSSAGATPAARSEVEEEVAASELAIGDVIRIRPGEDVAAGGLVWCGEGSFHQATIRSEEHTSELQSRQYLVCRLLLD